MPKSSAYPLTQEYLHSYANVLAELAEGISKDDSHGYSQSGRDGDGTTAQVTTSVGTFDVHGGDYDCSSLVDECLSKCGFKEYDGMTTYDEDEVLENAGFTKIPYDPDNVQRGDILIRHGDDREHTAIALDSKRQADASEPDAAGELGDQSGNEILSRTRQENWDYIWRPPAGTVAKQPGPRLHDKIQTQEEVDRAMGGGLGSVSESVKDFLSGISNMQFGHEDEPKNRPENAYEM